MEEGIFVHKKIVLIIIFTIGIVLSTVAFVQAKNNAMTIDLYNYERYVQEKRYTQAAQKLESLKIPIADNIKKSHPEKLNTVESMINTNLEILTDTSIDHHDKLLRAQQLNVMYDALTTSGAPLWHRFKTDLELSIEQILSEASITAQQVYEITYRWNVISPVLKMYLSNEEYRNLQVLFDDFDLNYINQENELQSVFQQMSLLDMESLQNNRIQTYFQWLTLIVIGFIFISLSYVGWIRYKVESKVNHTN
jgi:sporulation protein YpjB